MYLLHVFQHSLLDFGAKHRLSHLVHKTNCCFQDMILLTAERLRVNLSAVIFLTLHINLQHRFLQLLLSIRNISFLHSAGYLLNIILKQKKQTEYKLNIKIYLTDRARIFGCKESSIIESSSLIAGEYSLASFKSVLYPLKSPIAFFTRALST